MLEDLTGDHPYPLPLHMAGKDWVDDFTTAWMVAILRTVIGARLTPSRSVNVSASCRLDRRKSADRCERGTGVADLARAPVTRSELVRFAR